MITRRDTLRLAVSFLAGAVLGRRCPAHASSLLPTPAEAFAGLTPLWGDVHAHSSFSDARGRESSPSDVIDRAFKLGLDFFFLSDHGEQISHSELEELVRLTQYYQAHSRLFDIASEWTGIPDEGDPGIFANPAYVQGGGHVLLYRWSQLIAHHVQADGEPEIVAGSYAELLAVLAQQPWVLGGFAHPERYGVEASFGGFAPPPLPSLVRQMVLCELSSHGARGYYGPGDAAQGIRASNEAGYRELIRVGWHPGAAGSSDRHLMPYEAGPYTVIFVRERTLDALYRAIEQRRICFSEDRDMAIRLIGWLGEQTDRCYLMGDMLSVVQVPLWVHADVIGPIPISWVELVAVGDTPAADLEIRSHNLLPGEYNFGTEIAPDVLRARGIRAIYAKARLTNGRILVSSPIFLKR